MNKITLQHMASHTSQVSASEIDELKQLIGNYPFYSFPHAVMAKIYFEKEHYLFENALNQAAMRVSDREWLYHYIHGDAAITENSIPELEINSGIKHEEVIGEETLSEIAEITESEEFLQESKETERLQNDLSAFLSENDIMETSKEPIDMAEIVEPLLENITEVSDVDEDLHIQEIQEIVAEADEVNEDEEIDANPTMTASEVESVPEEEEEEETLKQEAPIHPDMALRKNPVYNVETFLGEEKELNKKGTLIHNDKEKDFFNWLSHPEHEVVTEQMDDDNPSEEAKEENLADTDKTLSIIEQFIKANPSISRPKKEFYSAENMAKRSENVEFDFVSETLANIYYEQGNIDLAIKAYQKLSLQNPLKQTYFASLIEKIKKEKR